MVKTLMLPCLVKMDDLLIFILSLISLGVVYWVLFGEKKHKSFI